jgi:hypothetical protein
MNNNGGPLRPSQAVAAWERYLLAEQRALLARAQGILARALLQALPEESREELDRWAQEDRRLAKEGFVELMDEEGEIYHKHIDEPDPWDVADRLRAETARSDWLAMRTSERIERLHARRLLGRGRRQGKRLPISRRELEVLKGMAESWLALEEIMSEEIASEEPQGAEGERYRCVVDGCAREVVVVRASREEDHRAPPSCHGRKMGPVE